MGSTSDLIVPSSSIDEAVAALDADPARRNEGRESFRDWMQQLADRAITELADVHFDIPEPNRRIEGMLARSEEHTSELQSLMRSSYAVFCLKKKTKKNRSRQVNNS